MLRRIARLSAQSTLIISATAAWLFGGCGGSDVTVAEIYDAAPPSFIAPDAEPTSVEAGLLSYCPSNVCPAGFATCADSRFPCDVNLGTDRSNCGACGSECPSDGLGNIYTCVEGRCVLSCENLNLDCDGIVDNGCETNPADSENCGGCGVKCTDPDKPCVPQPGGFHGLFACGCPNDGLYCRRRGCVDSKKDDYNCGGCGIACDPEGNGGPLYDDTVYYGCKNGECDHLKCTFGNADCDGDITNGCETRITTSPNCGVCGHACPAGQDCRFDSPSNTFQCKCPQGQTLCGGGCDDDVCYGECKDLASDPHNCGGCGIDCMGGVSQHADEKAIPTCQYGSCKRTCLQGWADCNGNTDDSCEVNTDSDPNNCGGCGIVCDAISGQACVLGRCVVAPCDQDAGGPTR